MPANYGRGAYGEGNYSAPTATVLTAAAGACAESGLVSGLIWQARVPAGFGGFGLAGLSCGLRAGFAAMAAVGAFALAGRLAGLLWRALAAIGEGVFALAGQALFLAAQWIVQSTPGTAVLAGEAAGLLSGNVWARAPDDAASWSPVSGEADPWAPVGDEPVGPDQTIWILQ